MSKPGGSDYTESEAYESIEGLSRKIGQHNYKKRTGWTVRRDNVHIDHEAGGLWHECSDDYGRAWEAGLLAFKKWDPDRPGGMGVDSFLLWRMYRAGNDTSWWRGGAPLPKSVIYPYLATAELDDDPNARRLAWIEMGYTGALFDQVHGITNWVEPTIPGVADYFDGGEPVVQEAPAQGGNVVDPEFEGQLRLFETEDLTEVERLVYQFRSWGYTNAQTDDRISPDLLPKDASPKWRAEKVSMIYSEALRKRARFFNYSD